MGASPLEMLERIEKIKSTLEEPPTTAGSRPAASGRFRTAASGSRQSAFEAAKSSSATFFEAKRFSHIIPVQPFD